MAPISYVTILIGLVLTLYGFFSYSVSETRSVTALIPAFFGLGFVVLGALAVRDRFRKHAMHAAALLGVIGFLGGAAMGFPKLPALLAGDIPDQAALNKAQSQNLLAFTCLVFVILCVNSFVQARRRRGSSTPEST